MPRRCLILGSARCLQIDIDKAIEVGEYDGVVACKGAGLSWRGKLDAWVSLHPDRFPGDIARRRALGYPDADRTFGHKPMPGVSDDMPYKFPGQKRSGSSGLFAVKVAMFLGFDRLVLCGIPLSKEYGRISDGREAMEERWRGAHSFKQGFTEVLPQIRPYVRSMSGWTKTMLGEPTPAWLND